jgi:hypothetical protein
MISENMDDSDLAIFTVEIYIFAEDLIASEIFGDRFWNGVSL